VVTPYLAARCFPPTKTSTPVYRAALGESPNESGQVFVSEEMGFSSLPKCLFDLIAPRLLFTSALPFVCRPSDLSSARSTLWPAHLKLTAGVVRRSPRAWNVGVGPLLGGPCFFLSIGRAHDAYAQSDHSCETTCLFSISARFLLGAQIICRAGVESILGL